MATTIPKKMSSAGPTPPSSVNECTDTSTPERVKKVPRMVRLNVARRSERFQTRSIARRCWTMAECKKAVAVNQGSKAEFSTGSQDQYPPQPRTW